MLVPGRPVVASGGERGQTQDSSLVARQAHKSRHSVINVGLGSLAGRP